MEGKAKEVENNYHSPSIFDEEEAEEEIVIPTRSIVPLESRIRYLKGTEQPYKKNMVKSIIRSTSIITPTEQSIESTIISDPDIPVLKSSSSIVQASPEEYSLAQQLSSSSSTVTPSEVATISPPSPPPAIIHEEKEDLLPSSVPALPVPLLFTAAIPTTVADEASSIKTIVKPAEGEQPQQIQEIGDKQQQEQTDLQAEQQPEQQPESEEEEEQSQITKEKAISRIESRSEDYGEVEAELELEEEELQAAKALVSTTQHLETIKPTPFPSGSSSTVGSRVLLDGDGQHPLPSIAEKSPSTSSSTPASPLKTAAVEVVVESIVGEKDKTEKKMTMLETSATFIDSTTAIQEVSDNNNSLNNNHHHHSNDHDGVITSSSAAAATELSAQDVIAGTDTAVSIKIAVDTTIPPSPSSTSALAINLDPSINDSSNIDAIIPDVPTAADPATSTAPQVEADISASIIDQDHHLQQHQPQNQVVETNNTNRIVDDNHDHNTASSAAAFTSDVTTVANNMIKMEKNEKEEATAVNPPPEAVVVKVEESLEEALEAERRLLEEAGIEPIIRDDEEDEDETEASSKKKVKEPLEPYKKVDTAFSQMMRSTSSKLKSFDYNRLKRSNTGRKNRRSGGLDRDPNAPIPKALKSIAANERYRPPYGGGVFYEYADLMRINRTKEYFGLYDNELEGYLTTSDFEKIFRMPRTKFYELPLWRQRQLKVEKKLF